MSQDQAEPETRSPEAQAQGLREHPPTSAAHGERQDPSAEQSRPVKAGRAILILGGGGDRRRLQRNIGASAG